MPKLSIKNFGPIDALGIDEPLEIKHIVLIIGDQATGKSTLAKLFSMFSWIEKALVMDLIKEGHISKKFEKQYLRYHHIDVFLKETSYIKYVGDAYSFTYSDGEIVVDALPKGHYTLPKIIYTPAERNLVSLIVDYPSLSRHLSRAFSDFLVEFKKASHRYQAIQLPIKGQSFAYNPNEDEYFIKINNDPHPIPLKTASSGILQIVPLLLVARLVKDSVGQETHTSIYPEDTQYQRFVNIIEEPEQNLFPRTQKEVLFQLIQYFNVSDQNTLLITSHSPYILSYLSLATYASQLYQDAQGKPDILASLDQIIPKEYTIPASQITILEAKQNGFSPLSISYGVPSDQHQLNDYLEESNTTFGDFLDLKAKLQKND